MNDTWVYLQDNSILVGESDTLELNIKLTKSGDVLNIIKYTEGSRVDYEGDTFVITMDSKVVIVVLQKSFKRVKDLWVRCVVL